ncbi:MscL family protein [candidate division WWE3 bacterium]|nr:MscL family protein [candidate division WWE3 bacterium]
MKGFIDFIREQGVVGLAVGFILGGGVAKIVDSLVQDIINPVLGLILGAAGSLNEAVLTIGEAQIRWGSFVNTAIDFTIIAFIVYFGVKALKLDKLDKTEAA